MLLKAVLCVTQHQHLNINIAGYKKQFTNIQLMCNTCKSTNHVEIYMYWNYTVAKI